MKVVYNSCYGGFSLSRKCAEYMADLGNVECIEMLKDGADNVSPSDFYGGLYETPRHDAILILAIESLGEAASGENSDLHIREISGDRYYIDEYDGSESVVTPNDIRWVVV